MAIGQLLATLAALAVGLILVVLVVVGDVIAVAGCAICDNSPPNYFGAIVITVVGAMLAWLIFLVWRAACSNGSYRR